MTLQQIETSILSLIGYDSYAELSISTDVGKIADFSLLHQCVNFARDEIRINCYIPGLTKYTAGIKTIASTNAYTIPETDFDLPIKVFNISITGGVTGFVGELSPINYQNFLSKLGNQDVPSDPPTFYEFAEATAAGLSVIWLYPTPKVGGDYVLIVYKPVLANVSASTDEDLIMKKYSLAVLQIATAYAFQFLKKSKEEFSLWLQLGRANFKDINLRETGSDFESTIKVDNLLATRRSERYTI